MTAPELDDRLVQVDEPRRGFAGWWEGLSRSQRIAFSLVGVVVAVNLAFSALGGLVGSNPGGPVSSSFGTGSDGLRGWYDLLDRSGHPVSRRRGAVADQSFSRRETLVLADPGILAGADRRRLAAFVRGGGRLVVTGEGADSVVRIVAATSAPDVVSAGTTRTWVPVPETAGVRRVVGGGVGWVRADPVLRPVAGDTDGAATVLVADVGRGRVVAVADTTVFWNGQLDRADNAALALAVVGPVPRPVSFLEAVHGYGSTGIGALPATWRMAGSGLALALLMGMWSVGSRFGAAEPDRRQLRPARRDHVDAVAADLDRVVITDGECVETLLTATRAALAQTVGAPPDASDAVLWAAGDAAGISPHDLAVLTQPVERADQALAVGAVAARRQRARHGLPATAPATVPSDPASGGTSP